MLPLMLMDIQTPFFCCFSLIRCHADAVFAIIVFRYCRRRHFLFFFFLRGDTLRYERHDDALR